MPVPKKRHTKSRRNKRRGNIFLKKPSLASCLKCGREVKPHLLCHNCGYYKGREIVNVFRKMDKKERKEKEKELHSGQGKSLSMEELSKK